MNKPFGVLIVEDDFRIAGINRTLVERAADFRVVGMARSRDEALAWLVTHAEEVDLMLLDVYLPDVEGLGLLWEVRRLYRHIDIVMVTAAKEVDVVEEALRGGVFDYLIKPMDGERVDRMLGRFRGRRQLLQARRELSQEELDSTMMSHDLAHGTRRRGGLPKGIDGMTLETVADALRAASAPVTASDLAARIGSSRSTARRYLEHLVASGQALAELSYGDVGRPQRLYRIKLAAPCPK